MKYHERKPDIETESMKIWTPNEEELKEIKKEKDDGDIKVKIGDMDFTLQGFTNRIINNNGKETFAYKIKGNMLLYYDYKIEGDEERIKEILMGFTAIATRMGKDIQNIEDVMKRMMNDNGIMKMVDDKVKDKEKNERTKNS